MGGWVGDCGFQRSPSLPRSPTAAACMAGSSHGARSQPPTCSGVSLAACFRYCGRLHSFSSAVSARSAPCGRSRPGGQSDRRGGGRRRSNESVRHGEVPAGLAGTALLATGPSLVPSACLFIPPSFTPRPSPLSKGPTRGHGERVNPLAWPPAVGGSVPRPHQVACRVKGQQQGQACSVGSAHRSGKRRRPAQAARGLVRPASQRAQFAAGPPAGLGGGPPIMSASVSRPGMRTIS